MHLKIPQKIGNKLRLYFAFLLLGVLSSAIIAAALLSLRSLAQDVAGIAKKEYPITRMAIEMQGLMGQVIEKLDTAKAAASTQRLKEIEPLDTRLRALFKSLQDLHEANQDTANAALVRKLLAAYIEANDIGADMVRAAIDLEFGREAELMPIFKARTTFIFSTLERLVTESAEAHNRNTQHILAISSLMAKALLIAFVILSGVGCVTFLLVSNMSKKLAAMSAESSTAAGALLSSMAYIADMSTQLSAETSESAAHLDQITTSTKTIAAQAGENLQLAKSAGKSTQQVLTTANQAEEIIRKVVEAMSGMADADREISSLVRVIEDIAFQTNLLALNAAVEAARAGEAGAGFAVVADEVRRLATRASEASQKAAEVIGRLDEKIHEGETVIFTLKTTFPEVSKATRNVAQQMEKITENSNSQADNQDKVNQTISAVDSSVQSLAAMSEESAATVQEVSDQVQRLNTLVDELMTFWEGHADHYDHRIAALPQ
jgi:archaellum component FlaC